MKIGIPTEVKDSERRIAVTPDKVELLVSQGHKVAIQKDSGIYASCPDQLYVAAGASIVSNAQDIWDQSDMVIKVKEPQPEEFKYFREGLIVFTFLHLAAGLELTRHLCDSKVTGIAFETVEDVNGSLPLLTPMSEIAGRLAPQIAARLLQTDFGGPGRLLGGVPGSESCRMVVVGGGNVGLSAALIGTSMGARVIVFDRNLERLRYIEHISRNGIKTIMSTPTRLTEYLTRADVVIGSVLIPGASAPKVITREMMDTMKPSALIMDVAIDQGGSVEGIRATSHNMPTYLDNELIKFAVPNIPGTVATTASVALSNSTYEAISKIATEGVENTVKEAGPLSKGINTLNGYITYRGVASAHDMPYLPAAEAIGQ